jgi:hypothetical protein
MQESWRKAVQNLETQMAGSQDSLVLHKAFNSLAYILWTGQLQGLHDPIELHQLSVYFTRDWLTDDHELIMLDVLKEDLSRRGENTCFVENTAFITLLSAAYQNKEGYPME